MDRLQKLLLTVIRVYVGWQWLHAAWGKLTNPAWVGSQAGTAIKGFFNHSLQLATGEHPAVLDWYARFIEHVALPASGLFTYLIPIGETLVGVGLILGALTGLAAAAGAFMNLNFLLAGTVSTNPVLLLLQLALFAYRRAAAAYGLDAWLQPRLAAWLPRRRAGSLERGTAA